MEFKVSKKKKKKKPYHPVLKNPGDFLVSPSVSRARNSLLQSLKEFAQCNIAADARALSWA